MNFIKLLFKNNGHLRGTLYFAAAVLTPLVASLEHWSQTPPPNLYAVFAVLLGALLAGIVTLRAFLDQHISRNPAPSEQPAAPAVNKLTTKLP